MFILEKAINDWKRHLYKHKALDEGNIEEMEWHLRDSIEEAMNNGKDERTAFENAIDELGSIDDMVTEEYSNIQVKTSIRSMLFKAMLSNYFKSTARSLMKNPLNTFINIFGLAVAIGACMVTYAFIDFDLSIDRFHENKNEIFLSTYRIEREDNTYEFGDSPGPLAKMLASDFSNVKYAARVYDMNAIVKHGDKVFRESIRCVDPDFLNMFTFPLKWGTSESLADVNSVILSEDISQKYFGQQNPLGKKIEIIVDKENIKVFRIAGVAKRFPKAHIIGFSFLINIENGKSLNPMLNLGNWSNHIDAAFIQVDNPADIDAIKGKMNRYEKLQNEANTNRQIASFDFISLNDLHLSSDEIQWDISYDSSDEGRVGLPFIAGFILALACFNYLNIAIVSASRRLKEIAMRKVIGASRKLVVFQIMTENVIMTFIAGILGFVLASLIFLPWFSSFADIASEFNLVDPHFWIAMLSLLAMTGVVSGLYPAFYISRFQPIQIFNGTLKFGKGSNISKIFLMLQLVLTCVGIGFAVIFAQNSWYQGNRSWGYEKEHVLYAMPGTSDLGRLKSIMEQNSKVRAVAGAKHHISMEYKTTEISMPDKVYEVGEIKVGENYLDVMRVELKQGRFMGSDKNSIVVNELLIDHLELDKPLGQSIKLDSNSYRIVGVVENFHFYNFYHDQVPMVFTLANERDLQYLALRVAENSKDSIYRELQAAWSEILPHSPFIGGFQEDSWPGFYDDLNTMKRFSLAVAMVFVILASLGLYGLIQFNIKGRTKEFSIRKTLGAASRHIVKDIASQYYLIFCIAIVLGIPATYLLNGAMLAMMFADPLPHGYIGAVASAILLIIVLAMVIATQVRKVSKSNPVEGLKVE